MFSRISEAHDRSKTAIPSIKQFKSRFSGYKYLKKHEWIAVANEIRKRASAKLDSEVLLHGRPIDRDRLKRAVQRYGAKDQTPDSRKGEP